MESKKVNVENRFLASSEKKAYREQLLTQEESKLLEEKRKLEEQLKVVFDRLSEIAKERENISTSMGEIEKAKQTVSKYSIYLILLIIKRPGYHQF